MIQCPDCWRKFDRNEHGQGTRKRCMECSKPHNTEKRNYYLNVTRKQNYRYNKLEKHYTNIFNILKQVI